MGLEAPYPLQMEGKVIPRLPAWLQRTRHPHRQRPRRRQPDTMDRRYHVRGVLWLRVPPPTAFTPELTNYIIRHDHDNHGFGDVLRVQRISHGDVDRVQLG